MRRVQTVVMAADPVLRAGIVNLLEHRTEVELLDQDGPGRDPLIVMCADDAGELLAAGPQNAPKPAYTVLVVSRMNKAQLLEVVELGVTAVVWRREATSDRLVRAVQLVDRGAGDLPADLLGGLLGEVGRARRARGAGTEPLPMGLSSREVDVIRLVSEGMETKEIAAKLCYSERTIKGVLHDVMTRLELRNRAHVVAHAAREGYLRWT
ncbi:helix-turn-helix transcriptional regulator [Catenulispora rubra]|uniref:helix-turn-helix transcriptional regulator n=1 Tax=Catenulispora rubra TaxID=280293 RepID=UPI002B26BDAB|nr:LuxR C-terminal-related transcriptional regulator [Catenulispora rubra]